MGPPRKAKGYRRGPGDSRDGKQESGFLNGLAFAAATVDNSTILD
jgi:hypothetical protein